MVTKKKTSKKRISEVVTAAELISAETKLRAEVDKALDARKEVFQAVSDKSIDDLAEYFKNTTEEIKNRILPLEKRNYVIYLRKSTDDEAKQVRSIDDQRDECLTLAKQLNIDPKRVTILEESASAKKSGNRLIFNDMLRGFRTGKYHGLISWSPDRISRNMKEAGEVIEMIDEEIIQDLRFKTYTFDNTPNGKMMLGILFATSKQYSDKLSVDVRRGTDGNIKEGKYNGVVKKGYCVDETSGYFIPDDYYWGILRMAVDMRLNQKKTNAEIADFLNDAKLAVRRDQDSEFKRIRMTKNMVGDFFADSFYCGLYQYGNNVVDLTDLHNFAPLITPDEYIQLNSDVAKDFGKKVSVRTNRSKQLDYGLLRHKVICDYCDGPMRFQNTVIVRGKNAGKWMISFSCSNTDCVRLNKAKQKRMGIKPARSIRAKHVLAAIEWTLQNATIKSQEAYKFHIEMLKTQIAADKAIATRKLNEAKLELKINEGKYARYQTLHLEDRASYDKYHTGKLEQHQQLIEQAQASIDDNKAKLAQLGTSLPTKKEFFELTQSHLLELRKNDDLAKIDAIANEVVANLRAGDDVISVIKLNPPYNLMVDLTKTTGNLSWSG
ncbi:MAG: site-specific recombinase [Patescibacteria group bacterium]|nr:site-specific recombinase [Patescibacteria group bacterium]